MSGDDEGDDATVFRPAGGGATGNAGPVPPRGPLGAAAPSPGYAVQPSGFSPPPGQPVGAPSGGASGGGSIEFAPGELAIYGPEPVVAAAGRLIQLANHIKTMAIGPDLDALRRTTVAELDAFAKRARNLGLEQRSVQFAHYILCAFLDDAVMSTPWGGQSQWSTHSLLVVYHKDAQSGDRMFQFAQQMERDPGSEPRLIELLYLCLSLGFEGRAALDPRGQNVLVQRRAALAALVQRQRAAPSGELSPQWHGQKIAAGRFGTTIPLWAVLAGIGVLALLIFAAFLMSLSSRGTAAIDAVDKAVGNEAPPPPPAPPAETQTPLYEKFQDILRPDIAAGRLELTREGNEIVIRLMNVGLFASAQADASSSWSDTFGHLAQAANLTQGPLKIEGHTDDQAIHSLQFPSNQELSEARATSVVSAIRQAGLSDPGRLKIAGFGATQPIGDNATPEGRTHNRRVEMRVENNVNWR